VWGERSVSIRGAVIRNRGSAGTSRGGGGSDKKGPGLRGGERVLSYRSYRGRGEPAPVPVEQKRFAAKQLPKANTLPAKST